MLSFKITGPIMLHDSLLFQSDIPGRYLCARHSHSCIGRIYSFPLFVFLSHMATRRPDGQLREESSDRQKQERVAGRAQLLRIG